ncbi:MAG: hypothetical protein AAGG38_03865 [Planctomycetota bacterium]
MKYVFCLLVSVTMLQGCVYYKIHDNASGTEYITNNWKMNTNPYTGSMGFTDMKTGKFVILQTYERETISKMDADIEIGR